MGKNNKNMTIGEIKSKLGIKDRKIELDKLPIEDLIQEIGLYLPTIDVIQCFDDEKIVQEFLEKEIDDPYETIRFIKKYEKYFNKNRFIFADYLMMSGHKQLEEIDLKGKITNRKSKMQLIEKHLAEHPIIIVDADPDTMLGVVYDSRDYASKSQREAHVNEKDKAITRIEEIDEKIDFNYYLLVQVLTDLGKIYTKIPEIGNAMRDNIIINTHRNDEGMTKETLLKLLNSEVESPKNFYEFLPYFEKEIIKNAEYIDWDKFLLLSAFRARNTLEETPLSTFNGSSREEEILLKIMETSLELIQNPRTTLNAKIEILEKGSKKISYTTKDLKRDLSQKVIDGRYYGKAELEEIKRDLLSGKKKISDIYSRRIIELLRLNREEKRECMNKHQENAIDLFRNGFIQEKDLKQYLSEIEIKEVTIRELLTLKKEDKEPLISKEELLELYLNENISLENIIKINQLEDLVTEKELVKQYKKLKECTHEEKPRIERYFSLFRAVKLTGKDEETKREVANDVVIELGDSMEEEDFIELYKRNIVDMETIIDWNSTEFAIDMFKKGILKPADSKKLANNGTIGINSIKAGLLSGLTNEEKISVIITTFDGEDQQDLREELFQTLGILNDEKTESDKPNNGKKIKPENEVEPEPEPTPKPPEPKGKSYEFDPCYKIQLLSLIDKDYRARLRTDGHMIFELPNLNKVIIEKMFRKDIKGKIVNANDAATYILDLDTLNSEDIISKTGRVNRTKLYELAKKNKIERRYHTKNWGDTIKEAFDIEKSERHSEQDKRQIDEIIEKSKRTRKLRTI